MSHCNENIVSITMILLHTTLYCKALLASNIDTVEHTYDVCPKYSKLGSFRIITYLYVTVAAADSTSTVKKKYSVFIYSEVEPHAMYTIYKQTLTLCVLQYDIPVFSLTSTANCGCHVLMVHQEISHFLFSYH